MGALTALVQSDVERPLSTGDIGKVVVVPWKNAPADKGLVISARGPQDSRTKVYQESCKIIFPFGEPNGAIGVIAIPNTDSWRSDDPNNRLVRDITPHVIEVVNCGGGSIVYPWQGERYRELNKYLSFVGLSTYVP